MAIIHMSNTESAGTRSVVAIVSDVGGRRLPKVVTFCLVVLVSSIVVTVETSVSVKTLGVVDFGVVGLVVTRTVGAISVAVCSDVVT